MKPFVLMLPLFGFLFFHVPAHAEGNCPTGYYPIGGQGVQGCAPIPGYDQQQPSQAPVAPAPRWGSSWGAIATDGTHGVLGTTSGALTRNSAEYDAIKNCEARGGTQCALDVSYGNSCAAMLVGDHGYSIKTGRTQDEAIKNATKACNAADQNCHVYYSNCSLATRIQ